MENQKNKIWNILGEVYSDVSENCPKELVVFYNQIVEAIKLGQPIVNII